MPQNINYRLQFSLPDEGGRATGALSVVIVSAAVLHFNDVFVLVGAGGGLAVQLSLYLLLLVEVLHPDDLLG